MSAVPPGADSPGSRRPGLLRCAAAVVLTAVLAAVGLAFGLVSFPIGLPVIYVSVLASRSAFRLLRSRHFAELRRMCTLGAVATAAVGAPVVVVGVAQWLRGEHTTGALILGYGLLFMSAATLYLVLMDLHRPTLREIGSAFRWSGPLAPMDIDQAMGPGSGRRRATLLALAGTASLGACGITLLAAEGPRILVCTVGRIEADEQFEITSTRSAGGWTLLPGIAGDLAIPGGFEVHFDPFARTADIDAVVQRARSNANVAKVLQDPASTEDC